MKGLALALTIFAASGASHSHFIDPFDTYMDGVVSKQPVSELSRFAAECRVPVHSVQSTYAMDGEQVSSLSKAVSELEKDHFGTAQVWKSDGRRFVVLWSYDLEQEYRISYCFGDDGNLRFEDVRTWRFELPSGKGWIYVRRWASNGSGRLVASPGRFSSTKGHPISKPKLDLEDEKNLDYHDDIQKLGDLKLPASMLR